jgi:hypothetical protein
MPGAAADSAVLPPEIPVAASLHLGQAAIVSRPCSEGTKTIPQPINTNIIGITIKAAIEEHRLIGADMDAATWPGIAIVAGSPLLDAISTDRAIAVGSAAARRFGRAILGATDGNSGDAAHLPVSAKMVVGRKLGATTMTPAEADPTSRRDWTTSNAVSTP